MKIKTAVASILLLSILVMAATPPALINYQGVLRDDAGAPLSGIFVMTFRFYDDSAPGEPDDLLLTDAHAAVPVDQGLFSVQLGAGAISPGSEPNLAEMFRDNAAVWLEIQVGTETLSPRVQVLASAYAQNAKTLDGNEASAFAQKGQAETIAGSWTFTRAEGTWGTIRMGSPDHYSEWSEEGGLYSGIPMDTVASVRNGNGTTAWVAGTSDMIIQSYLVDWPLSPSFYVATPTHPEHAANKEYADTHGPAETDPQVGTLTAGKWCTTNGVVVQCTSDPPTDHGVLTGLADDDHPQYFAVSQNEMVTGIPAFNGGTPGSSSPFTVDSTYRVVNLNVDMVDGFHASSFGDSHSLDAFDGSPADVVFVDSAGNVGVGTTAPSAKLDVQGTVHLFGAMQTRVCYQSYTAESDGLLLAEILARSDGDRGIVQGTTESITLSAAVHDYGWTDAHVPNNSFTLPVRKGNDYFITCVTTAGSPGYNIYWVPLGHPAGGFSEPASPSTPTPAPEGAAGLPTIVKGSDTVPAKGNCKPRQLPGVPESANRPSIQYLPAAHSISPGDVLVLNPANGDELYPCNLPADPMVVGIAAEGGGFGVQSSEFGDGVGGAWLPASSVQLPVVVGGVTLVKADATLTPIAKGDLLVTAATPGHSMKAQRPIEPGTVVGKALEDLPAGTGLIRVLVMLR